MRKRKHSQKKHQGNLRRSSNSPKVGTYFIRYFASVISVFVVVCIVTFASSVLHFSVFEQGFCANSITCIKNLSVDVENNAVGTFEGQTIVPPKINLADNTKNQAVLGASVSPGEKHIYVDLTTQTLTAYQGDTLVLKTFVSSGKWHPTPDGTFTIWTKLRATRMAGGSGADYYDLPNVPFTMYFYNKDVPKSAGFALHGAYWHDNFGYPMSHGCVNLRTVDAEKLYNWVDPPTTGDTTMATAVHPGTQITISGTAPN